MVKEFKIKNEISRDILFQSPLFERWVKDKCGYSYYNNEFTNDIQYSDEITNPASSSKILTKTRLYDEIVKNPTSFYNEVLSGLRVPSLIMVNKGNTLFVGDSEDNTDMLVHNDNIPTQRQIVYANGFLSDLNSQPLRWDELYNDKFIRHIWETDYSIEIICRED